MTFTPVIYCALNTADAESVSPATIRASYEENMKCKASLQAVIAEGIDDPDTAALSLMLKYGVRRTSLICMGAIIGTEATAFADDELPAWAEDYCSCHRVDKGVLMEVLTDLQAPSLAVQKLLAQVSKAERLCWLCETPLYRYDWQYANENGEQTTYRLSKKANIACKDHITWAIGHLYRNNCLDSDSVLAHMTDVAGLSRVCYVTANTIQYKDWDGRISRQNKDWAKGITVCPEDRHRFVIDQAHTGLVDLFARKLRLAIQEGVASPFAD